MITSQVDPLRRGTPEGQGIPSSAIRDWVRAVGAAGELHSVMIVRHGVVVAEAWWKPYRPDAVHLLYSLSKSFTSTAVGFAVEEGLVDLDDLVVDLFPDRLPETVDGPLAALSVHHLLCMSAGHAVDSTGTVTREQDWVRAFLAQPFAHEPGTEFLYDTAATYVLSAIVQQATGMTVLDYLRPRLFEPLGIIHVEWQSCPMGVNVGGWGMSATTEALAKFGQLYLQRGMWGERRILPESWIDLATSIQTPTPPGFLTAEWQQGYGYQFWRCRHGAYRADGAFGQNCVVMPDQDAVVVITGNSNEVQRQLDAIWEILLPAMADGPLPQDPETLAALASELSTASVSMPVGAATSPVGDRVTGATFAVESNALGVDTLTFHFGDGRCLIDLDGQRLGCATGGWVDGLVTLADTPPEVDSMLGHRELRGTLLAASGAWTDESTYDMTWQYYTTPHHDRVTCRFDGDTVEVEFLNSITAAMKAAYPTLPPPHPEPRPVLRGRL